jgi:hypothetical protein
LGLLLCPYRFDRGAGDVNVTVQAAPVCRRAMRL